MAALDTWMTTVSVSKPQFCFITLAIPQKGGQGFSWTVKSAIDGETQIQWIKILCKKCVSVCVFSLHKQKSAWLIVITEASVWPYQQKNSLFISLLQNVFLLQLSVIAVWWRTEKTERKNEKKVIKTWKITCIVTKVQCFFLLAFNWVNLPSCFCFHVQLLKLDNFVDSN